MGKLKIDRFQILRHAYLNGIRSGDFIIAINDWYTAHLNHNDNIELLKVALNSRNAVKVTLCRPNQSEWTSFRSGPEKTLHEGIVTKISGMLRRRSPRYLILNRKELLAQKENNAAKTYEVESLALSVSPPKVTESAKNTFSLVTNKGEVDYDCNDSLSAILWQHSIQCVIRRVFDNDLPILKQEIPEKNITPPLSSIDNLSPLRDNFGLLIYSKVSLPTVGSEIKEEVSSTALTTLLETEVSLPNVRFAKDFIKTN